MPEPSGNDESTPSKFAEEAAPAEKDIKQLPNWLDMEREPLARPVTPDVKTVVEQQTTSNLKEYLSKNYGVGSSSASTGKSMKKKKKKASTMALDNCKIVDEEEQVTGWKTVKSEDEDDEMPQLEMSTVESRELNTSKWKRIGEPEPEDEAPQLVTSDGKTLVDAETRRKLLSREAELSGPSPSDNHKSSKTGKRKRLRSLSPVDDNVERMSSGVAVGLQTAQQVREQLQRRQRENEQELNSMDPNLSGRGAETVHRDKYGRKIDLVARRAAMRKQIEEEEMRMKWGKEEDRRKEEELMNKPLTIYKDDKDLNEDLKAQKRWNDPAAAFLKKNTERPKYQGPPAPPNRFNMQPGHRWDGLDRSNGFERAYFEKQNTRASLASQAYSWSVEDM